MRGDWESEGDCDGEGDYNYGGEVRATATARQHGRR